MNALEESAKYAKLNPPRRRPRIYSHAANDAILARIPPSILEAMYRVGWTPLGIYEVADEELRKEKREQRKAKKNGT